MGQHQRARLGKHAQPSRVASMPIITLQAMPCEDVVNVLLNLVRRLGRPIGRRPVLAHDFPQPSWSTSRTWRKEILHGHVLESPRYLLLLPRTLLETVLRGTQAAGNQFVPLPLVGHALGLP